MSTRPLVDKLVVVLQVKCSIILLKKKLKCQTLYISIFLIYCGFLIFLIFYGLKIVSFSTTSPNVILSNSKIGVVIGHGSSFIIKRPIQCPSFCQYQPCIIPHPKRRVLLQDRFLILTLLYILLFSEYFSLGQSLAKCLSYHTKCIYTLSYLIEWTYYIF